MRVRPYYENWFAKLINVGAITLYPFVLFSMPKSQALEVVKHECVHVRQVRNLGWFTFYARYVWQWARGMLSGLSNDAAYRAISFEAEAYRTSKDVILSDSERAEFQL